MSGQNGSGLFSDKLPYKPHLSKNRPDGVAGEVGKLRADVTAALSVSAAITVDEFTNPIAATVDSVKLAVSSSESAQSYGVADFDGSTAGVFDPPRPVSVTCSDSAATWTGSVTVTGTDINGVTRTNTIALTNNATTTGTVCFAKVTNIAVPAQNDTDGELSFGNGVKIGFSKPIRSRAGAFAALSEITGGALLTLPTATFTGPSSNAPCGAYEPASAPNGTRDYALYYEYDPTA